MNHNEIQPSIQPERVNWLALSFAILAGLFLVGGGVFAYKLRAEYLTVSAWLFAMGILSVGSAAFLAMLDPRVIGPEDARKILILGFGGFAGFLISLLLGLGLGYEWWDTIAGGWKSWQAPGGWRVWACLFALVGGLAIMFVSLQLAVGDGQGASAFRRVYYGYNAMLHVALLGLILVIINVLVYLPWGPFAFFNNSYYWAGSSLLGLSDQSAKILGTLDKPVKIYAILPRMDLAYPDVHALLDNCREASPNIQVKYVSPDTDREEANQLVKDYKIPEARRGILLVSGSGEAAESRFIPYENIMIDRTGRMQSRGATRDDRIFNGESQLMTELKSLMSGKDSSVIYITQGEGEPDITTLGGGTKADAGLGSFKQKLEAGKHTVRGLRLTSIEGMTPPGPEVVISQKVPDDCGVLVIVGPKQPFEEKALAAIRDYLEPKEAGKKKGKLLALMDVALDDNKRMVQTGIEKILEEYRVRLGNDVVLTLNERNPEDVICVTNPTQDSQSSNELIRLLDDFTMLLSKVRTVRYDSSLGKADAMRQRGESLLAAFPPPFGQRSLLLETNFSTPPGELIVEYRRRKDLGSRLLREPPPIGVIVSDLVPGDGAPAGPHGMPNMEEKPRLAVIGNGSFVTNRYMNTQGTPRGFTLVSAILAWLREKPVGITIEPKAKEFYTVKNDIDVGRMVGMPALLMCLCIIGIGTSVWIVRRR